MKRSTRSKRERAREGREYEDHFHRLADELLLLIFTKVADFKFLCQCSLVSKHFASAIRCIPAISITIPCPERKSSVHWHPAFCAGPYRPHMENAVEFLKKFLAVRYLNVEFQSQGNDNDDGDGGGDRPSFWLKWKAEFGIHMESLVVIHESGDTEMARSTKCLAAYFDGFLWHFLLLVLVQNHPTLQSITITDTRKQGKICVKDEQLVEFRRALMRSPVMPCKDYYGAYKIYARGRWNSHTFGQIPVLRLPWSGHSMKDVRVSIWRNLEKQPPVNTNNDDLIAWHFEEEEKLLGEALTCVLMNHKDRLKTEYY